MSVRPVADTGAAAGPTALPVVCDNGHDHSTTAAIRLTGTATYTTVNGVKVGARVAPCPVCGAGGRIPPGTYYGPEATR